MTDEQQQRIIAMCAFFAAWPFLVTAIRSLLQRATRTKTEDWRGFAYHFGQLLGLGWATCKKIGRRAI